MPGHLRRTKFTAGSTFWLKVTDRLHCVASQPVTFCRWREWGEPLGCLNSFENNFVSSNHRYKPCRAKAGIPALSVPMLKFFHMSLDMKALLGKTLDDHPV
jgi:hypothetical protein